MELKSSHTDYILAIESSCDDTSAAVMKGTTLLSNVTASQEVHRIYGGVVPELASRAHQQNIVPVVDHALKSAGIKKEELAAIAFNGTDANIPPLPFLCLLVSGGNSQIIKVNAYNNMEVLGQTIDDAAGEAIDKCSKVMGLGYPGGPIIDKLARQGNPKAYTFAEPHIPGLDYSFSGLKTSFLYSMQKWVTEDPNFIEHHKEDIAASLEWTIVDILMKKLKLAVKQTGIKHVAVAGGVSANNGLRNAFHDHAKRYGWTVYIPKFSYTTDNAAMIGCVAAYKLKDKDFCPVTAPAFSKVTIK